MAVVFLLSWREFFYERQVVQLLFKVNILAGVAEWRDTHDFILGLPVNNSRDVYNNWGEIGILTIVDKRNRKYYDSNRRDSHDLLASLASLYTLFK